jgi:DNA-binding beta-propeller fold protein YncE
MRTRFTWILAVLALVSIGLVMACSTKYSSSSNGLVIVPTQGAYVMETFNLDLSSGRAAQINNANGPPINGVPTSLILDPAGAFAYLIIYQNPAVAGSATGIETFQVASDGKLTAGNTTTLNLTSPTVSVPCVTPSGTQNIMVGVQATPVVPGSLAIDTAGKYLFVADVATSGQTLPYQCNGATVTSTVPVPGTVSAFAVSSGALNEVAGSPFPLPFPTGGQAPSASALAVTPTVFPVQFAYCSGHTAPTTENLYVTDSANYVLLNYSVDLPTGALVPPLNSTTVQSIPTGTVPSGVAVDPCNRFVYVANARPNNNVSAYTICSVVSSSCPQADFSLQPVTGPLIPAGDVPGPMAVDPYGNYLYVVDTGSSQVSGYRISPASGSLTAIAGTPVATNVGPNSIAIRSDDTWVFVANFTSANISQYALTPASGTLTPQPPITTLNQPTAVAVK